MKGTDACLIAANPQVELAHPPQANLLLVGRVQLVVASLHGRIEQLELAVVLFDHRAGFKQPSKQSIICNVTDQ
jgi:hypothetical protein